MSRRSTKEPYLLFKADVRSIALNMSCINAVPVLWCVATTRKTFDAEIFDFVLVAFFVFVKPPSTLRLKRRSSAAIRATSSTFEFVRSASASR